MKWTKFRPASPVPKGFTHCWKNNAYTVYSVVMQFPIGNMLYLSIKHNDKRHTHDWRDLQRIKNDLAGTNAEAVELYPAADRLIDTSNQFHLWCCAPQDRFPFGYQQRDVIHTQSELEQQTGKGARQRDYADHHRDTSLPSIGLAWSAYFNQPIGE